MPKTPAPQPTKQVGQPIEGEIDYPALKQQLQQQVKELLSQTNDEYTQKVLEKLPDVFDSLLTLAEGFKLQATKEDKDGNVNTSIFLVPPHWPAVKYLSDWARSLMGQAGKVVKHTLDPESEKLMREYIEAQARAGRARLVDAVRGEDGVVELT